MSNLLWRVWWSGSNGVIKSVAGDFSRHREAMACIDQLSARYPNAAFTIEYIGKALEHDHGGRSTNKH